MPVTRDHFEAEVARYRTLLEEGLEAMRITRDYVGHPLMPAVEGWAWFDWTEKVRAELEVER